MLKIDAHQHFWSYDAIRDNWISEDMSILQDDFMPENLQPILENYGFQGSVVVQSDQSAVENYFQLKNVADFPFIKGIVGWVDLRSENINEQLAEYSRSDKIKGFRHILQGEKDRDLMLRPDFKQGISELKQFGYTYDILVLPDQLKSCLELVRSFPDQLFILDHIGKPDIKNQHLSDWSKDIIALASHENVYCKVSGIVTQADWKNWNTEDFNPYLDLIFENFGPARVMFGSDWPVCRLAATYGQVTALLERYTSQFSENEQALFWGSNAVKFYNLNC